MILCSGAEGGDFGDLLFGCGGADGLAFAMAMILSWLTKSFTRGTSQASPGTFAQCTGGGPDFDLPVEIGRGDIVGIVAPADVRLPFGPSKAVTTCSVSFSNRQNVARAAR